MIARVEVLLVECLERGEHVALLRGLHALGRREVENRIAAGAERRALVSGGKEALAVDRRARADAAFEQDDEAGQILVLAAESVENPGAEAGPPDARPAVVDQELRLRVREALVEAGADDGEVVDAFGRVREQVGDFDAGLAVLREGALGAEDHGVAEFAVLEVLVAEAFGRMLAVQFRQQRLGIVGVDLARAALHEEGDDALGGGGQGRLLGRERLAPSAAAPVF